jgi:hypothetical protein
MVLEQLDEYSRTVPYGSIVGTVRDDDDVAGRCLEQYGSSDPSRWRCGVRRPSRNRSPGAVSSAREIAARGSVQHRRSARRTPPEQG